MLVCGWSDLLWTGFYPDHVDQEFYTFTFQSSLSLLPKRAFVLLDHFTRMLGVRDAIEVKWGGQEYG